jgi:hypothetical protein
MGFIRKPGLIGSERLLKQESHLPLLDLTLSHHLKKIKCSSGRGIYKEEERFLKEMVVKVTSYNVIKMAAYYYKMAALL